MIQPLPSDILFKHSPDAGHSTCICSRCSKRIGEDQVPLRVWTTNEKDEVDENSQEYRYCEECQEGMGIKHYKNYDNLEDI
jgi:hypothetical protein